MPRGPYILPVGSYLSFIAFALVIVLAPGPDTLLTLRSSIAGGRAAGLTTALGVSVAGAVQGVLAALGLGALIIKAEPVFQTIKWAGVAYLVYLGVTALRAAWRAKDEGIDLNGKKRRPWMAFQSGFICNITNPKVLMFNVAVLPQFVSAGAGLPELLTYALTLTVLGGLYLFGLVMIATRARNVLLRKRVRRSTDVVGGVAMLAFGTSLALEA